MSWYHSKRNRALEAQPVRYERRDPQVATLTTLGVSTSTPLISEWDAEEAVRVAYLQNVYVYRCVQVISTAIAGLPFRAGADPEEPGNFNPDAPLAQFLGPPPGGPNPQVSPRRLWAWTIAQRLITGRFAWEIETSSELGGGLVRGIWPLVSAMIEPVPASGGSEYFSGFVYGRNELTRRFLTPDQVLYAWNPSQHDFRQPESVLQAARLDINVAVMQDRYDVAFLKNDARPAAIIVHQEFAEKSERQAFRDQFIASHGGVSNAGKPVFIEATEGPEDVSKTFHIESLGLSQRDAEFIARYESKIRAICVAFGTPLSLLGDASGRTFDNAGQEYTNWWEGTLLPLIQDIQDDVNLKLAPRLGREVGWFDLTGVKALQGANFIATLGAAQVVTLIENGVIMPDELRTEVGLDPLPNGAGEFQDPALQDQLAELQAELDAANQQLSLAPPVEDQLALPPARAAKPRENRAMRQLVEYRVVDGHIKALERSWENQLRREFKRQARDVLRKLRSRARRLERVVAGYEGRDQPLTSDLVEAVTETTAIFDKAEFQAALEDVVDSLYEEVVSFAGSRVTSRYGGVFSLEAPWVQTFIRSRSNQLAGGVTNTTYRAITRALSRGVHEGDSVDGLAARVQHVFDVASSARARTIARTEVISAYNGSTYQSATEAPRAAVAGLEWLSTPGSRTRPAHSAAHGQRVPVGGMFSVGGDQLRFPGDPQGRAKNIINCRCTVAPLTPDELEGRSRVLVRTGHAVDLLTRVALGELDAESATTQLYQEA